MSLEEEIAKLKEQLKTVRIQRNNYQQLLIVSEKMLWEFKTLPVLISYGHSFHRYLMSDEFAEEMKCSKCGYTIYPYRNDEQVAAAMKNIEGKVTFCKQ